MRKYTKIFVGVLVLALFLLFLRSVTGMASGSYADEVASAVESDRRRFRPENSLDISMAMGLVTHEPPQMLSPPAQGPPLLLYPPSAETLARLSG
jgi:uncharacterized protein involved in cysteine biosynthesis